jgi:hypothetical protein
MTHQCATKGYMVAPGEWLPTEPFDYDWTIGGLFIGCNQLKCGNCGEMVRATIEGNVRKYTCACNWNPVSYGGQSVGAPINEMTGEMLPWACCGHPSLTRPTTLDGVALSVSSDWKTIARDTIGRKLAPPGVAKASNLRGFWMQRLYNLVGDGAPIAAAMAELLSDADARMRVAATSFFTTNSRAPGAERAAQAMDEHPELFAGVPDPDNEKLTLWDWMESVLSLRIDEDPVAEKVLKERALSPPGIGAGIFTLARTRPDWLADHAQEVLNAAPEDWKRLVYSLRNVSSALVLNLARQVVQRRLASRDDIVEWARLELGEPHHEHFATGIS